MFLTEVFGAQGNLHRPPEEVLRQKDVGKKMGNNSLSSF
jgi:hypothetical protein